MLIIAAIISAVVFLLNTRVRIYVIYREDELYSYYRVFWFIKKQLAPEPVPKQHLTIKELKKTRKKLRRSLKKTDKNQAKEKTSVTKAFGDVKDMVKELLELVIIILKRFIGKVKIKVRELDITVATGDAASTALSYAVVCNTLDVLIDILSDRDRINCRFIRPEVKCDYLARRFSATVDILITIRIWQVIKGLFESLMEEIKKTI